MQRQPKKIPAFFLMLAAAMVIGAESGSEPVDPHQAARNAETEMLKCFYAEAASLDDHVSDASTIATGVVSACQSQIDGWKYAYFEELRPLDAKLFYKDLDRAAPNLAIEVVLKVRAAARRFAAGLERDEFLQTGASV